jgi:hypothetical protein
MSRICNTNILCKASMGLPNRMFKPSINFIEPVFSEYSQFQFISYPVYFNLFIVLWRDSRCGTVITWDFTTMFFFMCRTTFHIDATPTTQIMKHQHCHTFALWLTTVRPKMVVDSILLQFPWWGNEETRPYVVLLIFTVTKFRLNNVAIEEERESCSIVWVLELSLYWPATDSILPSLHTCLINSLCFQITLQALRFSLFCQLPCHNSPLSYSDINPT